MTVGENTVILSDVKIGKGAMAWGEIMAADYSNETLESDGIIIRAGGLK